jgi:hypothetical protein
MLKINIYFFIFSNLVKLISFYIWRIRYSSNMEDLKKANYSFHFIAEAAPSVTMIPVRDQANII